MLASDSYKDCHISGSVNVPVANLEKKLSTWDKNTEIVVYCAHNECPASTNAYEILKKMRFTNVSAYEGGMKEWAQKGYDKDGYDKDGSCVCFGLS